MKNYKCKICGKNHNVFSGLQSPLPDLISEIPEKERKNRVQEIEGIYLVDNQWVLTSGHIFINMINLDDPIFFWQVWVTISPNDLQNNLEKLENGETVKIEGRLQSHIPFYSKSKGLEASVIIYPTNEIEVEITEESKLKEDQSNPISKERVAEILSKMEHPELFRETPNFEKSFSERLRQELENVEEQFLGKDKLFAINIYSLRSVLFQIVNSQMLESEENQTSGFGLHLSFDELIEEMNQMKRQPFFTEFKYLILDDIPTCQLNLGSDKKRLEELIVKLIKNVYEQDIETIEIDSFEI